ncbi:RNA polymerase-binding protein RbpA [Cellulosimicrobium sp. Marseille-Q4280]|uniref:RNA polymerase-binding protein RbpA n=1 Tax=Cellulosimicrobium sp. Marseille-Q4280 TaxID=2937992 RepID=UPI00203EB361|nr:RNA polymerase-binding protein RbpA [Cellulosimicrobium sp. Marseille-Q4280]
MKYQTHVGTMPWSRGGNLLEAFGEQEDVLPAATRPVTYECAADHVTVLTFALDAKAPATWTCPRCSRDGALTDAGGGPVDDEEVAPPKPARTHMDMVRERRTTAELEALLAERLDLLRARRVAV